MTSVLFTCGDEYVKKPTLREFMLSNFGEKLPNQFHIVTIWLPGKYPNLVFETERFRAILYPNDVSYENVCSGINDLIDKSIGLAVRPDRGKEGKFDLVAMPKERPTYEPIGGTGFKVNYGK